MKKLNSEIYEADEITNLESEQEMLAKDIKDRMKGYEDEK